MSVQTYTSDKGNLHDRWEVKRKQPRKGADVDSTKCVEEPKRSVTNQLEGEVRISEGLICMRLMSGRSSGSKVYIRRIMGVHTLLRV